MPPACLASAAIVACTLLTWVSHARGVDDTRIRIWKPSDGSMVKELGKPRRGQFKDWMCAISLNHDESLLAGADMAGAVQVWTLAG